MKNTNCGLSNGVIYCTLIDKLKHGNKRAKYLCYVLRYGKVEFKQASWSSELDFSFSLKNTGLYSIQIHELLDDVKTVHHTPTYRFIEEQDLAAYRHFAESKVAEPKEIEQEVLPYPYQRLGIAVSKGGEFTPPVGMKHRKLTVANKFLYVLFQEEQPEDQHIFFSGSYISNSDLIFGTEDRSRSDAAPANEIGSYTCIKIEKNGDVEFSTDYFGVSKIYQFENDEFFFATNSYRELIDLITSNRINVEFRSERIAANFVFLTLQPFHQLFTSELDIPNAKLTSIDKKIVIKGGVALEVAAKIAEDSAASRATALPDYQTLLNKAADEIKANTLACLKHPRFESVVIDLSGGMDSRVVYSAATHFPEHYKKISIHSRYSKSEPKDLDVAVSLNSIYRFPFDQIPSIKKPFYGENPWSKSINHNLGLYYSYTPNSLTQTLRKTLRLVGFYGEICARPYYARPYLNTPLDVVDSTNFAEKYIEKFQHLAVIEGSNIGVKYLKTKFIQELSLTLGRTALQNFDFHYLMFRNGLHCGDAGRIEISCPEFGPIMSKSLFLLKQLYFDEHKSIKIQLDLLNLLNPLLACHEYQSEKDNADKETLTVSGQLLWVSDALASAKIRSNPPLSTWRNAEEKRVEGISYLQDESKHKDFEEFYKNQSAIRVGWALGALNYLIRKSYIEKNSLGLDLWMLLTGNSPVKNSDAVAWNLFNRLLSCYYQVKLTRQT